MPGYIHHIEWCVSQLDHLSDQLVNQFGFRVIAERQVKLHDLVEVKQLVLKSGLTQFMLTEKRSTDSCSRFVGSNTTHDEVDPVKNGCSDKEEFQTKKSRLDEDNSSYPVLTCCTSAHSIDSVFNVCLEVGDVDKVTSNIMKANGRMPNTKALVLIPPTTITVKSPQEDSDVSIRYAVVQTPCGNVIHTLINTHEYKKKAGLPFLPGFTNLVDERPFSYEALRTTHMDHVTYVCRPKQSFDILKWYKICFGMQPFQIVDSNNGNIEASAKKTEDEKDEEKQFNLASVDIHEEVGMRMTVGEWITSWLCNEEGVKFPDVDEVFNFKLVLAEPLEENSHSHVQQFLDNHGGPGLQHIGLTAPNVSETVEWMSSNGAKFRAPPPAYYQLEQKRQEIQAANEDIENFKKLGLLLDSEADINLSEGIQDKFLIQIFTKPIFFPSQDTFFLEILERRGARGFGAGNITALARSIILQQQIEDEAKKSKENAILSVN